MVTRLHNDFQVTILVAKFKIKLQAPELTAMMLGKCSFQDRWLKDSAYQEWVLKDKLDKHHAQCAACEIRLILCVFLTAAVVLTKSNIGPCKSL